MGMNEWGAVSLVALSISFVLFLGELARRLWRIGYLNRAHQRFLQAHAETLPFPDIMSTEHLGFKGLDFMDGALHSCFIGTLWTPGEWLWAEHRTVHIASNCKNIPEEDCMCGIYIANLHEALKHVTIGGVCVLTEGTGKRILYQHGMRAARARIVAVVQLDKRPSRVERQAGQAYGLPLIRREHCQEFIDNYYQYITKQPQFVGSPRDGIGDFPKEN